MLPGLGVGAQDAATLISRVSVVFHAAATVKFDEALKLSLQMNVLGTKRLVELCHKMERLVVRRKGEEDGGDDMGKERKERCRREKEKGDRLGMK